MIKNKNIFYLYLLIGGVFGIQSLEGLPGSALSFYFKETLHLNPSAMMYISAIISLVWFVKFIWGYLLDNVKTPKFWMVTSILISLSTSLYFGLNQVIVLPLLIGLLLFNSWAEAFRSTGAGGLTCSEGKRYANTGKLQSIREGSQIAITILTGVAGGFIAQYTSYHFGFLCLIPFYLILLIIVCLYKPAEKDATCSKTSFIDTVKSYKEVFTNKQFLWICLIVFLYNFNPSFGTPLFFKMRDTFHFSKIFFGILDSLSATTSLIGVAFYFKFSKKLNLKKWIRNSIFIGATTSLSYLYFTQYTAVIYSLIFSIVGSFISLIILDFMAQSSIKGKEAVSFAVLCSITNLSGTCSLLTGAWLFPKVGLTILIILSAVTSFICLPFLKHLKLETINENI
jgi:MFS family permease